MQISDALEHLVDALKHLLEEQVGIRVVVETRNLSPARLSVELQRLRQGAVVQTQHFDSQITGRRFGRSLQPLANACQSPGSLRHPHSDVLMVLGCQTV
jgi:hypothetical protein